METAANHNSGVLPAGFSAEAEKLPKIPEYNSPAAEPYKPPQIEPPTGSSEDISDYHSENYDYSERYTHVRYPEISRRGLLILMIFSGISGALAGIIPTLRGIIPTTELSGTFMEIFLSRISIGAAVLAAEYLLGFFAFGDLLVWALPLWYCMGGALRVTASARWKLLPGIIIGGILTAFGAAVSGAFSQGIMRVLKGGTVHFDDSPRRGFTLTFLGILAGILACCLYEAIILTL